MTRRSTWECRACQWRGAAPDSEKCPTCSGGLYLVTAPPPKVDTTPSWFTVQIGFVASGTDPDTIQLALGRLETLNVRLTLRGQAPFDATIVSVRRILDHDVRTDPDWERKQGIAYQRIIDEDDYMEAKSAEEFAPYADVVAIEVY